MNLTLDKKRKAAMLKNQLTLILLAAITGVFSGAAVTIYNVLTAYGEEYSAEWYKGVLANPGFIPLLFLALAAGAIVVGTAVKFVPLARGSGIPQIEVAIRGGIVLRWFRTLVTGFAASLAAVFLGLSAGSEGPSMLVGGCAGCGVGKAGRQGARRTRYLITGGASAGLAVAFNAPLTGFLFAFEEAHKKFTPEIFISAFFSVVSGVLTRNGLRLLLGLADPSITVSPAFQAFDLGVIGSFGETWSAMGAVAIGALVAGLLGVGFYYAVLASRRLFGRMTFLRSTGKFLIPFLLAGAFGLVSIYEMGGGHRLIEAVGTNGGTADFSVTLNFAAPVAVALAVVLVMKFIASVCNMGCGVPCGVFVPMLAMGACAGALVSLAAQGCGMSAEYSDIVVMVCMAAFFASVVKAPLTGIVMVFELTGSYNFNLLLPVMLGVAIGYVTGRLLRTEAIYDVLLESFLETDGVARKGIVERYTLRIAEGSPADGREIHDLLLPWSTVITDIAREGSDGIVPSGVTVLHAGDVLSVRTETDDRDETFGELTSVFGKQDTDGS